MNELRILQIHRFLTDHIIIHRNTVIAKAYLN